MDHSPKLPKIKSPKTLKEIEEAINSSPARQENELLSIYRTAVPPLVAALEEDTSRVIRRRGIMIQDLLKRLEDAGVLVRPHAVREVLREMGYAPRQTTIIGTTQVRASIWFRKNENSSGSDT